MAADLAADPPYLVTEYIQGPTLAEHVAAAGPLPPPLRFATDALDKVACPEPGDPNRVTVLTMTQTLTRPEVTTSAQPAPWLLVLQGGAHCSPNTGQAPYIENDRANYSCGTGGTVYGFLDRTRQPWRIRYLPKGSNAITTVLVLSAWT